MSESSLVMDIEAYAARYVGRGRIIRLRYISWRRKDLELDALRMAIDTAKSGRDTTLYKELVAQAAGRLGPDYDLDEEWVAKVDKEAAGELERLRRELEDHRQQHNKEVIRAGHNDLGDFFYSRGKMSNARGEYVIMRDYCMHTNHLMSMWMKVVLVSIDSGDFDNVESYVHTAEVVPDAETLPLELSKMRCCAGLAMLVRGRYKDAALRFVHTTVDTSEEKSTAMHALFNDVFSIEDIALYAGLCALATLGRNALLEDVLGNSEFRALLELGPNVYELIIDFCSTRYASCLARFEKLRPDLMLDPYLGRDNHVENLYARIRSKSLVQYIQPFESVDLTRMAKTFNTTVKLLESELLELIEEGTVSARIDTQNQSLHRKTQNTRNVSLRKALRTGEVALDEAEAMLLRMSLTKSGLTVAWPSSLGHHSSGMGNRVASVNSVPDNMFDPLPAPG